MKSTLLIVLLSLTITPKIVSQKPTQKPNIIFILSDDQQYDALGCMGNAFIETPNIDQLANRGILFERNYATTAICMASRATAMTGMYEYKTGCNFQKGSLSEADWKSLAYPILLRNSGYTTAFAGKWGFGISKKRYNASKDFDKFAALEGGQGEYETHKNPLMASYAKKYPHVTRALGAFGQDFIQESVDNKKPFCLSISYKAPHEPHHIIDPIDQKRYQGVEFPFPESFGEEGLDRLPTQAKSSRQYLQRKKWSTENYQEHLKAYYQLISGVDASVGMLIETLEETGVLENTIIIYTSDNGYFCGAHGLSGKVLPYDKGSRVPLIIADPRAPENAKGKVAPAVVGNIDIAPTILDLAGLPIPEKMDGLSLVPTIKNPNHRVREYLGIIQAWDVADRDMCKALAVISEDWKYINWCYADENMPLSEELFNLKKDANEMNNQAANPENNETLKEMQKYYDGFQKQWADDCKDPLYMRYSDIFNRHISWKDKSYLNYPEDEKRMKKWMPQMEAAYEDFTGEKYPSKQ